MLAQVSSFTFILKISGKRLSLCYSLEVQGSSVGKFISPSQRSWWFVNKLANKWWVSLWFIKSIIHAIYGWSIDIVTTTLKGRREGQSSYLLAHSSEAYSDCSWARWGARTQIVNPRPPCGWQDLNGLSFYHCLPKSIGRKLEWGAGARSCTEALLCGM